MSRISIDTARAALMAANVRDGAASEWALPLAEAFERYEITTPSRIGGFVGQCAIESARFERVEENLIYTTPARLCAVWPSRFHSIADALPYVRNPEALANRVYAGKIGNGDEASGDGFRFRGRGLKQLTGRANYAAASQAIGMDYLAEPDRVALPQDAALTAAWFWSESGCNRMADAHRWDTITRKVNGSAMLMAKERASVSRNVMAALVMRG